MLSRSLTITTASLALLPLLSAQSISTCGQFNLATPDNTGSSYLYVAANGTVILGRPLAEDSDSIAFNNYQIASNGAILVRANDTTLECGFGGSAGYFECDTVSGVEEREGTREELVFDFAIGDEGELSWRGNEAFWVCNALELGFAIDDLPAWQVVLSDEFNRIESEGLSDDLGEGIYEGCERIEVVASGCSGWNAGEEGGDDGEEDGDEDPGSDSPAVDGNTGGTQENSAGVLKSSWVVSIAAAALCLIL